MIPFKTPFYEKYIKPIALNLTNTEYAYLAGIIDTDGSISLARMGSSIHVPKYKVLIEICNNSYDLMKWLKERIPKFNTRTMRTRTQVFTIYHIGLCWKLLPNLVHRLVLKKKQAELVLKALELKYKFWRSQNEEYRRQLDELHQRLKWLNRKGKREDEEIENTYYDTCNKSELYAYLAGVIDGDGSIYADRRGVHQVSIGTKSAKYADWLCKHIEGSFVWYAHTAGVWLTTIKTDYFIHQLLSNIAPYVIVKREKTSTPL